MRSRSARENHDVYIYVYVFGECYESGAGLDRGGFGY